MALPQTDLRLVDPLASRVTKPTLLPFPRFMRIRGFLGSLIAILATAASASFLFMQAPTARAECTPNASSAPCPSPSPTPSPIPVHAFLSLDVSDGGPNTVINVTGGQFLPNEQMTLYWDQPNKVAGSATGDANGNFNTRVKPFSGDAFGPHRLCASVQPNPCATFTIDAPATSPSPSPTPTESPSPSPEATATTTPSPTPVAATLNGFDVISRPPFVFLPLFGAFAVAVSLLYWALSLIRRPPRPAALPSAAVMHRAMRPDYGAGFGTPPTPAPDPPQPSAWEEVTPPQAESSEPEPPHVDWGPGTPDAGYPELSSPDEPPELPEHGDLPEPGE